MIQAKMQFAIIMFWAAVVCVECERRGDRSARHIEKAIEYFHKLEKLLGEIDKSAFEDPFYGNGTTQLIRNVVHPNNGGPNIDALAEILQWAPATDENQHGSGDVSPRRSWRRSRDGSRDLPDLPPHKSRRRNAQNSPNKSPQISISSQKSQKNSGDAYLSKRQYMYTGCHPNFKYDPRDYDNSAVNAALHMVLTVMDFLPADMYNKPGCEVAHKLREVAVQYKSCDIPGVEIDVRSLLEAFCASDDFGPAELGETNRAFVNYGTASYILTKLFPEEVAVFDPNNIPNDFPEIFAVGLDGSKFPENKISIEDTIFTLVGFPTRLSLFPYRLGDQFNHQKWNLGIYEFLPNAHNSKPLIFPENPHIAVICDLVGNPKVACDERTCYDSLPRDLGEARLQSAHCMYTIEKPRIAFYQLSSYAVFS